MEDFASFAMGLSPEQRAAIMARAVRGQSLQDANQQAHSMDLPAMAAMMSNNPELSKAAEFGMKQRQAQYKPVQMGTQGFAIPATGDFVSSPMFEREHDAQRQSREQIAAQATLARQQMAHDAQQASLQRTREAIASREQIASEQRALRLTLGAIAGNSAAEKKAAAAEKAAAAAAEKAKGKTMSVAEITKLAAKDSLASDFGELFNGFKDEFGGSGSDTIGEIQNVLGKKQPLGIGKGYADRSNWWQNYNEKKNEIRHQLFGSALTKNEQEAFDKANITEGMATSEIRRRLGQQHAAATRAYNKILRNAREGGWNTSQFQEREEVGKAVPGGQPPAAGGAPAGVDPAVWQHMTPEERALWK